MPGHHRQREEGGLCGSAQARLWYLPRTPAAVVGHRSEDLQDEVSVHRTIQAASAFRSFTRVCDQLKLTVVLSFRTLLVNWSFNYL